MDHLSLVRKEAITIQRKPDTRIKTLFFADEKVGIVKPTSSSTREDSTSWSNEL